LKDEKREKTGGRGKAKVIDYLSSRIRVRYSASYSGSQHQSRPDGKNMRGEVIGKTLLENEIKKGGPEPCLEWENLEDFAACKDPEKP